MAVITNLFSPTVPCIEGAASAMMPVGECWLCLPASCVRPFVQTVRVVWSCPHCCWFPGTVPAVPESSRAPGMLHGDTCRAEPPPPRSSPAPPSTSQAPCSADPESCPSPPTPDCRQEKNMQSGLVSLGAFWLLRLKLDV